MQGNNPCHLTFLEGLRWQLRSKVCLHLTVLNQGTELLENLLCSLLLLYRLELTLVLQRY
jgi:hypothetical protein